MSNMWLRILDPESTIDDSVAVKTSEQVSYSLKGTIPRTDHTVLSDDIQRKTVDQLCRPASSLCGGV